MEDYFIPIIKVSNLKNKVKQNNDIKIIRYDFENIF